MKRENGMMTNNSQPSYSKTLPHPIFDTICEQGSVSEIEIFEYFGNRRIAIERIRYWTNGQFHLLSHRVENGQRIYFFSEHFKQRLGICSGGVPA